MLVMIVPIQYYIVPARSVFAVRLAPLEELRSDVDAERELKDVYERTVREYLDVWDRFDDDDWKYRPRWVGIMLARATNREIVTYARFARKHRQSEPGLLAYYLCWTSLRHSYYNRPQIWWITLARHCGRHIITDFPGTPEAAAAARRLAIGDDDAELDACRAFDRRLESIAREGEFHTSFPGFGENARADNLCRIGFLLVELGRLDEARQAYRRVLDEFPASDSASGAKRSVAGIEGLQSAYSLFEAGDYEASRTTCRATFSVTSDLAVERALRRLMNELSGLVESEAPEK